MGDPQRAAPAIDFYGILAIPKSAAIKEMCKAYKSLVTKWSPHKNPSSKEETEVKIQQINEVYMVLNGKGIQQSRLRINYEPTTPPPRDLQSPGDSSHNHRSMDESFFSQPSAVLSKSYSKKCRTTSPSPMSSSKNSNRSTSPRPDYSRSKSTGRFMSRTPPSNNLSKSSRRSVSPPVSNDPSRPKSIGRRSASETEIPSVIRSPTLMGSTAPIVYSQSTAWKVPPPIEKILECTLEELCLGCVRKIKFTREIISNGIIKKAEEALKINVKPGWKKGTKIKFEGMGDEKPGYLPADIIFIIEEKMHPLFTRKGDDLEYGLEIPLVQALTGCSISVPLLGGEQMHLFFDKTIIHPGFEKVIPGQGMPTKKEGMRGDLRIRFFVEFPLELSDEQRNEASCILQDCS